MDSISLQTKLCTIFVNFGVHILVTFSCRIILSKHFVSGENAPWQELDFSASVWGVLWYPLTHRKHCPCGSHEFKWAWPVPSGSVICGLFFCQIAKVEKLKPLELELRRLEDLSESVVNDFAYMKKREEEMRDTNGKLPCVSGSWSGIPHRHVSLTTAHG